jgi:glycosyltransferase involved in cell wall biosynthesis
LVVRLPLKTLPKQRYSTAERREIDHGVTGFHTRNVREAKAILRELVESDELRMRVGEAARDRVRQCRSIKVTADEWHDPIDRLLQDR